MMGRGRWSRWGPLWLKSKVSRLASLGPAGELSKGILLMCVDARVCFIQVYSHIYIFRGVAKVPAEMKAGEFF